MKTRLLLFLMVCIQFASAQKEVPGSFDAEFVVRQNLHYLLHIPKDTKAKKPLLIFLHGSGEKGTDVNLLRIHGPFKYLKTNTIDAYVLAPQCPIGEYWNPETLYELIQKIQKEYPIDANRIYLTGLSMGGWGAWNLAFAHPELFAALVPIAGFVDRVPMIEGCDKIKDIPIRIYHGLLDDVVDADYSTHIYQKLKPCHPDIKLELFDDANHDSWSRVYDNPGIYDWLLKQNRKPEIP